MKQVIYMGLVITVILFTLFTFQILMVLFWYRQINTQPDYSGNTILNEQTLKRVSDITKK